MQIFTSCRDTNPSALASSLLPRRPPAPLALIAEFRFVGAMDLPTPRLPISGSSRRSPWSSQVSSQVFPSRRLPACSSRPQHRLHPPARMSVEGRNGTDTPPNAHMHADPPALSSSGHILACSSPLQHVLLPWMQPTPRPRAVMEDIPPRRPSPRFLRPAALHTGALFASERMGTRCVLSARGFSACERTLLAPAARRTICLVVTEDNACLAFSPPPPFRARAPRLGHTCDRYPLNARGHCAASPVVAADTPPGDRERRPPLPFPSLPLCCLLCPRCACARDEGWLWTRTRGVRALLPCLHSRVTTSRHPPLAPTFLPPHSHSYPLSGHLRDMKRAMDFPSNSCVYLGSSSRKAGGGVEGVDVHARRHIRAQIPRPATMMLGPVALRDDVLLVFSPRCTPHPRCACAGDEGWL
jgi:hypothetical protein